MACRGPLLVLLALVACNDRATSTDPTESTTSGSTTGTDPTDSPTFQVDTGCISEFCFDDDLPPEDPCDLDAQDCPAGEKCTWNGDAVVCVPVAPQPAAPGQACATLGTFVDTCAAGALCWIDGLCHPLCTGPDAPCGGGATCVHVDGPAGVCADRCDPLMSTCPVGQVCVVPSDDVPVCAPDDSGPGGEAGDVCQFVNGCDPGLQCVSQAAFVDCAGSSCCTPFCDLDAPVCPEGQVCDAFYAEGAAPDGFDRLGVCIAG